MNKMEIKHIKTDEFDNVINSNKLVFVDFYADWCGPCKMLAPSVEKLANEHEEVQVVKINVDEEPSLAMQFGVQSIPTLITFKDGQPVNRQLGFMPYEALEDMIK